jgi:hypothetical protein
MRLLDEVDTPAHKMVLENTLVKLVQNIRCKTRENIGVR